MNRTSKVDKSEKTESIDPNSEKNSFFASVFNNNKAIMLLVDPENNQQIIDANKAALKFYGYTRAQILKLNMGSINTLPEEDRYRVMKKILKSSGSSFQFEHITSTGQLKNVEVNASPVEYKNKNVLFVIVHDITEFKRAEASLKESEERLGLAISGTDLGIWDWFVQAGEAHYNKKWAEIIGYTLEELSPLSINTWISKTHPDDMKESNYKLQKCFNKEIETYECEIRMKHKNGTWVWVQDKGRVFEWDKDGKPVRMSGTHLNITKQKLADLKIAESEKRYRSYFESSPLSLWEQDETEVIFYLEKLINSHKLDIKSLLDTYPEVIKKCVDLVKIIDVNPATLKLYNAQSKEDLLWSLSRVFTEEAYSSIKDELIYVYNKEKIPARETTNRLLNGKVINILVETAYLSDNRYIKIITDITEQKQIENNLVGLLAQTKADSETKEILLREINHRVKNNLSSFIGMLYAEKKQSSGNKNLVGMDHVDSLINRVKGISLAHELLSRSQWTPVSFYKLTDKIIHSLNHLIPKDRKVDVSLLPSNILLDADQSHGTAILINELYSNSIEHASHPGEKLEVKIEIKEKNETIFLLYRDSGPGYPEKVLQSDFSNVGMYLIANIIDQSLRGSFIISNDKGAKIEIEFPGGSRLEEL